jgi:LacI family transcriptional regulator
MSTMKDVAEEAKVSITTVSHVINGTRYVSEELSGRVEKAMEKLKYRPNILARGLKLGKTNTIGLIVPDNSNPYFAEIARVIEDIGFDSGYSVILCNSDGDIDKEISYVDVLTAKQVDGIIFIASSSQADHLSFLTGGEVPIVVADRETPNLDVDCVLVDNFSAGYDAAKFLLGLGHRRIGCITGPSNVTPSADRVDGYRRALADHGLQEDSRLIVKGDFQFEGGKRAMQELIELSARPTAVFVCNDVMAIAGMGVAHSMGLSIPEDLSIVGFDNIRQSSVTWPPMTTVAQPIEELARTSTELLLQGRSSPRADAKKRIVLQTKMIVRGSCRRLREHHD